MSDDMAEFKSFMEKIGGELNRVFNPAELKIGYALFVFPTDEDKDSASMISNVEELKVYDCVKPWVNRIGFIKNKILRRKIKKDA